MVFVDHKIGLKILSLERSVASPIDRLPIFCATSTKSANRLSNTSHTICCPRMQHAISLFLIIHCDPVCFNDESNRGFNMFGPWTLRTRPTIRRKYRLTMPTNHLKIRWNHCCTACIVVCYAFRELLPTAIHLHDHRRHLNRKELDMTSSCTSPTMNLVAFRSMFLLLERSCASVTSTRQSRSVSIAESADLIPVIIVEPKNGVTDFSSSTLLERCSLYSSKHNRSCDDVEGTLSLCKSLLDSNAQNEIIANEEFAASLPPPKMWMFQALGLLLLKELIALNFVQKSLLVVGQEEQRRSAEDVQILLHNIAYTNFPTLLQHPEPRLRKICSEVLYVIASNERNFFERLIESGAQLGSANKTIYFPLYHSTGLQLLLNVSDNLHRVSTSRHTNLGNEPLIPLDDTTGWLTLESSIIALHEIVRGYGAIFHMVQQECADQSPSTSSLLMSIHDILITQASNHLNPHIKESAFEFIRIICTPPALNKSTPKHDVTKVENNFKSTEFINNNDNPCDLETTSGIRMNTMHSDDGVFDKIVDALSMGMEDNWCRIRRCAVLATKNFLLSEILLEKKGLDKRNQLETGDVLGDGLVLSDRGILSRGTMSACWGKIIPGLCMSRFYVADGVCALAKDVWNGIINKHGNGRIIVSTYLTEIIDHYIHMSKASNHMVSESALLALSECLLRIEKPFILPHIPKIAENIVYCIHSESWPVKDSATIASGSLLQSYALECTEHSSHIVDTWCESLRNSIWSVRENAAIAFGEVLKHIVKNKREQDILRIVLNHISDNIFSAKKENLDDVKPVQFIPPEMLEFMLENERKNILKKKAEMDRMNNVSFPASDSNAEGTDTVKDDNAPANLRVSWGCCLDCMELRSGSPWEASDGCIYLIRELASSHPEEAMTFLPKIYELLTVQDYKFYDRLSTTILSQLPLIYTALNTSSVSTDGVTRNPGSSDSSSHVYSTVPNTFHTMDTIYLHPSLALSGVLNPDTSSVRDTEYPRPLGIQVPVPALKDLEPPIPTLSIVTLSLGNPRIGSGRGRGRGSNGGRGVENSSNPPDLSDGTFCSKTFSNGTFVAKIFVEEYATYLHSTLSCDFPLLATAAEDCVRGLGLLLGRAVLLHRVPFDFKKRFQQVFDESYTDYAALA